MTMGTDVLVVVTTLPDAATAERLAERLVADRLAACVSVFAPVRSVYRWQGAVESAAEVPLLVKTTRDRYPALEAAIRALHPYELPEIVALPVAAGLETYLAWVAEEVRVEGGA
jgi:periplasmic divalent cation tolerance protein